MKKIISISIILLFLGCQKDATNLVENTDPVFKAMFVIGGETQNIIAGQDNKYMFSGVKTDSLDVESYSGTLTNINGSKKSALSIIFRSATPDQTNLDSTFRVGEKELLSNFCGVPVSTQFKVKFLPQDSVGFASHKWMVNNSTSLDNEPVFVFDTNEVTNIPIYLHTNYSNGCMASSSRCLDFRNLNRFGDFKYEHQYGSTYLFSIPANIMSKVNKVTWYIGTSSFEGNSVFYDFFATSSEYFVSASILYKDGSESCVGKNIKIDANGAPVNCNNNIDFEIIETTNYDHLQLDKIEVNYWNENGKRYSSKWGASPGVLDIISIENYKVNKEGKQTKKVKFKGTITLYSLSGEEIVLEDLDAIMAIAIP